MKILPGRELLDEATQGLARGWSYTPQRGKAAVIEGWPTRPRATRDEILAWISGGFNLGVRTGAESGVFVVDFDLAKPGSDAARALLAEAPRTPTVQTGGHPDNRHLYFKCPGPIGNTTAVLAPHVDTKGDGGVIVSVGSVHPDTGKLYRWLVPPTEPLADLPAEWMARLGGPSPAQAPTHPPTSTLAIPDLSDHAHTALRDECDRVASAPDGQRHTAQLTAARRMARYLTVLDRAIVEESLVSAAVASGHSRHEAAIAIRDGLEYGARRVPDMLPMDLANRSTSGLPTLLVPGAHVTDRGEYIEVDVFGFADSVIAQIPKERLWRRGGAGGELMGVPGSRRFHPLARQRARLMVAGAARLIRWVSKKTDGEESHVQVFQPATADYGELVCSRTLDHPDIADLETLTNYPVCVPPSFTVTVKGLNPGGIYYDAPPGLNDLTPVQDVDAVRACLEDVVIDFPFGGQADRDNFFGLLFTPFVRPCIRGNVPMHLVTSPIDRTGKSKLCGEVLGGIILGEPTPDLQLSGSDDERDKRVLALLLSGQTLIHLDNLKDFIDSPVLASLLTSTTYQGRMLGVSQMLSVPNRMTVVASGNNVTATSEISKRIVPINLVSTQERPDTRTDFKHHDLRLYIQTNRLNILNHIMGGIQLWRTQGCPLSAVPMGGFEDWRAIVGGIMSCLGYSDWLSNRESFVTGSDDFGQDLSKLVAVWWSTYQDQVCSTSTLLSLAESADLFTDYMDFKSERGKQTTFGRMVLKRAAKRVVDRWRVCVEASGSSRRYYLEETGK